MTRHVRSGLGYLAALGLIIGACGGDDTTVSPEDRSATAPDTSPDDDDEPGDEPPIEGTGPETPLENRGDGVSIELARLPIGGSARPVEDSDPAIQCLEAAWLGGEPIDAGIEVEVTGFDLSPSSVAAIGTGGCAVNLPSCHGFRYTSGAQICEVVIIQSAPVEQPTRLELTISGRVHCDDTARCAAFVQANRNTPSQLDLEPLFPAAPPAGGNGSGTENGDDGREGGTTEEPGEPDEGGQGDGTTEPGG